MKAIAAITVIVLFMAYPLLSSANYLIQLNNGSKYVTPNYWEEGDEIKFYYSGGIIGFPKALVKEIKGSDLPYNEPQAREKPSEGVKTQSDSTKEKPSNDSVYRDKKESLEKQLREAMDTYNASLSHNDKEVTAEAYRAVSKVSAKIEALKKEVMEKYNGELPDWWR